MNALKTIPLEVVLGYSEFRVAGRDDYMGFAGAEGILHLAEFNWCATDFMVTMDITEDKIILQVATENGDWKSWELPVEPFVENIAND